MTKQLTPETDYGRYRCGERNENSKLSVEKVRLIRILLSKGNFQRTIAEVFGVSQDAISKINTSKTWRWV